MALVLLTVASFGGVRHADFVQLDDPAYVSENPHVAKGLTVSSIAWAFKTFDNANWHPLTWLSHLVDVELFGLDPGAHHVTNLVLHTVNTLLLFGLLVSTTGLPARSAFVAALFAVHPMHVESVAWIAERKDVLSTCFWLLTLWAYVAYVRHPIPRRYTLVVAVFALGLMAKPMLVTLPFVLLLLDVWPLRRSLGSMAPSLRALVVEKLPLLVLAAASSVVTVIAQQRGGAVMSLDALPFDTRLANAALAYVAYLGKLVWPADLTMFYPYRDPSLGTVVLAVLVLVLITTGVLALARRNVVPLIGWSWYLGTLVPVIGLVQVGRQAMADRYSYVPFIGLFIALAWVIPPIARRARLARAGVTLAATAIILASAAATRAQVEHWKSNGAFWQHALGVTLDLDPARARLAVAGLTNDEQNVSAFIARFFRQDPLQARAELGATFLAQGHIDEAITTFTEVLAVRPGLATTHERLGRANILKGRRDMAVASLIEAIRLDPMLQTAHSTLGRLFAERGQFDQAVQYLAEAVRLEPRDAESRCDLGLALSNQGRFEEALAQYAEALKLDPSLPELHNNLGLARAGQNRIADAVPHFAEAVRLKPNYVEALRNLGIAYLRLGRATEARRALQEVLRLQPDDAASRNALRLLGRTSLEP